MGACTIPGKMSIITEYCPKGNLEQVLYHPDSRLTLHRRMIMAKEAAAGLSWLHTQTPQILHRDIKPPNFLVDKNGTVKVCGMYINGSWQHLTFPADFGLSMVKPEKINYKDKKTVPGSPLYLAPEAMQGKTITDRVDVYAFGLMLWEMATQDRAFNDITTMAELKRRVCVEHGRPPLEQIPVQGIRDLLKICWHPDPKLRPSFNDIIKFIDDKVLVECAIEDEEAVKFWRNNFQTSETVLFDDFFPHFLTFVGVKDIDEVELECLIELLVTKNSDGIMEDTNVVTLLNFGKFLKFFGPARSTWKIDDDTEVEFNLLLRVSTIVMKEMGK